MLSKTVDVGVADGNRTRNPQSGNLMLHRLSYSDMVKIRKPLSAGLAYSGLLIEKLVIFQDVIKPGIESDGLHQKTLGEHPILDAHYNLSLNIHRNGVKQLFES